MERAKTIFLDIDGTLIYHSGNICTQITREPTVLKGTIEKLAEWDKKGYNIILVTGRREGSRKKTEKQLSKLGIIYDQLIMGIGGGDRILINDKKENSDIETAYAFSVKRNKGIKDIEI